MEAKTVRNNTSCYSIDQGGGKSACVILADVSPTLTTTHYGAPAVCYEDTTRNVLYRRRTSTQLETIKSNGHAELYAQSAVNNYEGEVSTYGR